MAWHQIGAKSLSNPMRTKLIKVNQILYTETEMSSFWWIFLALVGYKGCCKNVSGQQGVWVIKFNSLSGSEKKDQQQWVDLNQEVQNEYPILTGMQLFVSKPGYICLYFWYLETAYHTTYKSQFQEMGLIGQRLCLGCRFDAACIWWFSARLQ